jgi:dihydroneopterin aldolase
MSDLIKVTGIWGFGYHGVFEHEAKNGQDFFVDLEISLDLTKSSKSDDLKDTIVVEEITGERVELIERLAGRIADRIKGQFAEIEKIAVTVHKPKAPVSAQVADISVTITR